MDTSQSQSQNTDTLAQLLRHHGFYEVVTDDAVPIVSHLFSDYVTLKAAVAQFKAELVELKEASTFQTRLLQPLQQDNKHLLQENNQLRLRVAELEDYQKDPDIKAFPPQPEPFPMREQVPVYAEHAAMEEELNNLRKHMSEIKQQEAKVKDENSKLKSELQYNIQQNGVLTKQIQELQESMSRTRDIKPVKHHHKPKPGQAQVNPDVQSSIAANPPAQQTVQSQSVTRSSVVSTTSVQQVNQTVQTDEQLCFQCSVYQEEIQSLQQQLQISKKGPAGSGQFAANQINQLNQQVNQLQQLLDQKSQLISDLQGQVAQKELQLKQVQEQQADNETTVITTQMIHQKLEQRLQQQIDESLRLKQEILTLKETIQELNGNIGNVTQQKVKTEKTLQKMCALAEEQKNKLKLNDATIQRLDKANQTMSQYLSRLSLENQRLKQQIGISE